MNNIRIFAFGWAVLLGSTPSWADGLSLVQAKDLLRVAIDYARTHEAPGGAIAIVDDGGHVVLLERLDGTFPAAGAISIGKARTAALFRKPTRDFEELVNNGRTTMVALPDVTPFTPLRGGVPLIVDGQAVGAIGVSGAASAQQDDEIAQAAVDAFAKRHAAVTHFDAERVAEAFRRGSSLVEGGAYRVHASRRDAPGEAEIHPGETDIFYILDGAATLVTGGEIVEPRVESGGEIRGRAIRGGNSQRLRRGDVVVVPHGVPHWFSKVEAPFTYYVVKSVS